MITRESYVIDYEQSLSLRPSRATVNKPRGKNGRVKSWWRDAPRNPQESSRGQFFLMAFFESYAPINVVSFFLGGGGGGGRA